MNNYEEFNKINIPMYICDFDWHIVFRNRACKKYTTTPRLNMKLNSIFFEQERDTLLEEKGKACLRNCFIKQTYKTALCFEYHQAYVVMFPALFEFDCLWDSFLGNINNDFTDILRNVLDSVAESNYDIFDKYGFLEKVRKYTFSSHRQPSYIVVV